MVALPSAHGTGRAGIDPGARKRLAARFGSGVEAWFGELPGVLAVVAGGSLSPARRSRGSVPALFGCRIADGQRAVLTASPTAHAGRSRLPRRAPGTPLAPPR